VQFANESIAEPLVYTANIVTTLMCVSDDTVKQLLVVVVAAVDYPMRSQVNRIVCHPTLPVTITAHEDRHIRFFDNNSGKTCYVLLEMLQLSVTVSLHVMSICVEVKRTMLKSVCGCV